MVTLPSISIIKMKKILFPTDFSEAAKNAFEYALALAEAWQAQIDLVNIYSLPSSAAGEVSPEAEQIIKEQKAKQQKAKLLEFIQAYSSDNIRKTITFSHNFVGTALVELAKSGNYDMLIMGTKGERPRVEKFFGSVTTHVIKQSPCPVLAIPKEARYKNIQKIAYATDFHMTNIKAAHHLMQLAQSLGASVDFVHIATDPLNKRMKDVAVIKNYPFPATNYTIVKNPSVVEGLDQFIDNNRMDVLALFIPRRRLWERLFHGALSKQMAFHTSTPLLVFHQV